MVSPTTGGARRSEVPVSTALSTFLVASSMYFGIIKIISPRISEKELKLVVIIVVIV